MVQRAFARKAEGVPGKLAPLRQQIVPAGELAGNAKAAHGRTDNPELAVQVIFGARQDKAEVEIAQIMEHRAASGGAARQYDAFPRQKPAAAFAPGVLVASDNHGGRILPEKQGCAALRPAGQQQRLFAGKVAVRLGIGAAKNTRAHQRIRTSMVFCSSSSTRQTPSFSRSFSRSEKRLHPSARSLKLGYSVWMAPLRMDGLTQSNPFS